MDTEKKIDSAVAIGKKNKKTSELLHNWCGHLKIKKFGGTGLIELQTGLPIGHHSIECPYALSGGLATWDLEDAALLFFDGNCAGCKDRKPVNFPNILDLVKRRDDIQKKKKQEEEVIDKAVAARLAKRDKERENLRSAPDAISRAILDEISELDHNATSLAGERLIQTARLAPEKFPLPVIEHLFSLVETPEFALTEPVLGVLRELNVQRKRLCTVALRCLSVRRAQEVAAKIAADNISEIDPNCLDGAMAAVIDLALPPESGHVFENFRPKVPELLQRIYTSYPDTVRLAIGRILDEQSATRVDVAARGIVAIAQYNPRLPEVFARELTAKAVRAKWLINGEDDNISFASQNICSALTLAFQSNPTETDALLQSFLEGADETGATAVFDIYRKVLHRLRFNRAPQEISLSHQIAFRRLIWTAVNTRSEPLRQDLAGFFRGDPYEAVDLAAKEIDNLLGAAALIDDKLTLHDNTAEPPQDFLTRLERDTRRQVLKGLQRGFVEWAYVAAGKAGPVAIDKVLHFFRSLPENRENIRAAMVGRFEKLMVTTQGTKLVLPELYSALIGPSQVLRAGAASVLGNLRSRDRLDLPDLVYEAFVILLTDTYLIVHQAAVRALRYWRVPEIYRQAAMQSISSLIHYYSVRRDHDEFLMTCIELFARLWEPKSLTPHASSYLMHLMIEMTPREVAKELSFLRHHFQMAETYPVLLMHLLRDPDARTIYGDNILDELRVLPKRSVQSYREQLLQLTNNLASEIFVLAPLMVEIFSQAEAWSESAKIAKTAYDEIEETKWKKPIKLGAALRLIAAEYELAVANGDSLCMTELAEKWRVTFQEAEADRELHEARGHPF